MTGPVRSFFLAAAAFACLAPGLAAQAAKKPAAQGFLVPVENSGKSVPLVKLLAPAPGAVLPNIDMARTKKAVWEFTWAPVPGAELYQLIVMGKRATIPLVSVLTGSATHRTAETFRDGPIQLELAPRPLTHREALNGYVAEPNRFGWRWGVRAKVNGAWGAYGEQRVFDVAPLQPSPSAKEKAGRGR